MDFEIIIYTCNRAMQLDLLLRSMERFIKGYDPAKVRVFYRIPDEKLIDPGYGHYPGYGEITKRFRGLQWVRQNPFKQQLKRLANEIKSKYVLGLCDDYVFINPLDIDIPYVIGDSSPEPLLRKCVNLWLTPGMDFCFSQDRKMETARHYYKNTDCFWWDWTQLKDKKSDWAYPHNVAGHIYRTDYFRQMLRWSRLMSIRVSRARGLHSVNWRGLNTLEMAMNRWRRKSTPYMAGLFKQTLQHIAVNTAQNEYMFNQVGKKTDQTQDALAKLYLNGFQIRLEPFLKEYDRNGIKDVNFDFEKQT